MIFEKIKRGREGLKSSLSPYVFLGKRELSLKWLMINLWFYILEFFGVNKTDYFVKTFSLLPFYPVRRLKVG